VKRTKSVLERPICSQQADRLHWQSRPQQPEGTMQTVIESWQLEVKSQALTGTWQPPPLARLDDVQLAPLPIPRTCRSAIRQQLWHWSWTGGGIALAGTPTPRSHQSIDPCGSESPGPYRSWRLGDRQNPATSREVRSVAACRRHR